jgi:TRAP-type mannitol/chloroaromatic compound transport system permease small subunit
MTCCTDFLQPRTQAIIDLTLYIIFLPGVVALTTLAGRMPTSRWRSGSRPSMRTRSRSTFKFVIPAAGFMLLLAGIGDHPLRIKCIQTGVWPAGRHVEEVVETGKPWSM